MSAHEQSIQTAATAIEDLLVQLGVGESKEGDSAALMLSRAVLQATNPRIRSLQELESLPDESAVRTSDTGDTVVLKSKYGFTNAIGAEIPADTLWRYGTHPFHLIYRPAPEVSVEIEARAALAMFDIEATPEMIELVANGGRNDRI